MSGRGGGRGRWRRAAREGGTTSAADALAQALGLELRKVYASLFVFVSVASLVCSTCLVGVSVDWRTSAIISVPWGFETSTVDVFLVSLALAILLPILAWRATKTLPAGGGEEDESSGCSCYKCYYRIYPPAGYSSLLSTDDSQTIPTRSGINSMAQPLLAASHDASINIKAKDAEDGEKASEERRKKWERRRDLHLLALFLLSTASQVFLAIKAITFKFDNEALQGSLMGVGVLFVNIQVAVLRCLVVQITSELDSGVFLPALHKHKLLPQGKGAIMHRCDVCGLKCGANSSRCKVCDWDVCITCLRREQKKEASTQEGALRSDKGSRQDEGEEKEKKKSYMPKVLALLKTERLLFSIGMAFLLVGNLTSLLTPTVQGSILDAVFSNNEGKFKHWIFIYVAAAVTQGVVSSVKSLCFNVIGRRITATLKLKLFRSILSQDVAFFDGSHSGDLSSRLTSDIWFLVAPIQQLLGSVVSNTLLLVGGVILCFVTSWRLSLLAFTTVGPIVYVTQTYAEWSQHINAEIYAAAGRANSIAIEALTNIRTVKSCGTEGYEQRRFFDASYEALTKGVKDAWVGSLMTCINSYLDLFSTVLILWYGGTLAMRNDQSMTAGKLIAYQLYFNMLNGAYSSLLDLVTQLTRSAGASSRVFDLMDALPAIDIRKGKPVSKEGIRGDIALKAVDFCYQMRPEKQVLKAVSLQIPAGSVCALVGHSGGGKSTIVSLLQRMYDPTAGSVEFDGEDVKNLRLKDLRRSMGVVAQQTDLYAGTIEENIWYGCDDEDEDEDELEEQMADGDLLLALERRMAAKSPPSSSTSSSSSSSSEEASSSVRPRSITHEMVVEAAKKACAYDFIMSFPDGFATRIGERGVRISGGQKQRISIARCFLRRPKILLLDEATSALDAESEAQVQVALDRLIAEGGATIILCAHRLSTVINAHQICVLSEGGIIEKGTHEALFEARGTYFQLVQRQLRKKADILEDEAENEAEKEG